MARNPFHGNIIGSYIENRAVPMPDEDTDILNHVLELASIKEKDIAPYKIYYLFSSKITSNVGVSKPWKDEKHICHRAVAFGMPFAGMPVSETDKKWGFGFSIGCFYKRYGESDPDRSLSDYVLASYAQTEGSPGFDPKKRLQEDPPEHLIPVLRILDKIWGRNPKERQDAVRKIWNEDFGANDLQKALPYAL